MAIGIRWHFVRVSCKAVVASHKDKGIGQVGWTYVVVCCLLKFQSCIGHGEVLVRIDHSSIVQRYKEDLCTQTFRSSWSVS